MRATAINLCFFLAAALAPSVLAGERGAAAFPGIETLMSEAEFSAAGLDRLSAEELEALNAWLLRYTAGEAEVLQAGNTAVREARDDFEVTSRLVGDFRGWDGDTVFRLENGQVWRQRLDGRYIYRGPPNPEVRISRNWLGFYKLTLVEDGRGVGVTPAP
jgi:hypothetical protein